MKSKLKTNLILMEIAFLLIVIGGSGMVYAIFAAPIYSKEKARVMREAFEDVREADMSRMDENTMELLESYEADHYSFTICDSDFQPVYTTAKRDPEGEVRRNIVIRQEYFSADPQVEQRHGRNYEGLRLLGTFLQDGETYYIYIRETSASPYGAFTYTERFLFVVVILAVFLGTIVMYVMSRRITRPIETMAAVSRQLAEHDFSARVKEETPYEEVNTLARNFNEMARQLQYYIQELEKNNKELCASNEQLLEQREKKEALEQMRQEFSANISHELKTPLAVIASQVEMLQMVEEEEKRQYYFESIREEIDKMSSMIRNLLKISAAEHHLADLEMQSLDLRDAAEYLMLKYDALFRQKEIKRIFRMEGCSRVWGDRSSLEQVMSNYLLNAFAHTGSGAKMEISLEQREKQVYFLVYNEGTPIREEELEKIWDNYYQGQKNEDHAGLGLYIVKSAMVLHHGQCGVVNREKGVEFWFSLPLYQEGQET